MNTSISYQCGRTGPTAPLSSGVVSERVSLHAANSFTPIGLRRVLEAGIVVATRWWLKELLEKACLGLAPV
ncbi:MAG: hypothetical protein NTW21_28285 [Verrucomicrobia bacterium]|nr:hypothetical protein [Verrucomicrobiota bacterium]